VMEIVVVLVLLGVAAGVVVKLDPFVSDLS
jgi:hypothetical protein